MTASGVACLDDIRACFEGAIPALVATCAADGTPNVAYISQVYFAGEGHVALSFQFFNKTRKNILAHPYATALLLDPRTAQFHRLHLRYQRTETEGALFEGMKAQLAGIASHEGMQGVFRLLGADVYEVERIESLEGDPLPAAPAGPAHLGAVRRAAERLSQCTTLAEALNATLAALGQHLGVRHAMVLMRDERGERLYTVASTGYTTSGVGSEVAMGEGVIGVAARERTPVRIGHVVSATLYSHAMRSSLEANVPDLDAATQIPYPGLAQPHSQLAVPLLAGGRLLGVLFAESGHDLAFGYEEEDAFVAIAGHLAAAIEWMQSHGEGSEAPVPTPEPAAARGGGAPLVVKHFAANDSIFVNDAYLIKGVAGAILAKLLRDHLALGRSEFTNRELRLDRALGLPEVSDNLEARLLLLQRRLAEQSPHLRIEKTGRGRFRLALDRPVELVAA